MCIWFLYHKHNYEEHTLNAPLPRLADIGSLFLCNIDPHFLSMIYINVIAMHLSLRKYDYDKDEKEAQWTLTAREYVCGWTKVNAASHPRNQTIGYRLVGLLYITLNGSWYAFCTIYQHHSQLKSLYDGAVKLFLHSIDI